MSVKIGYFVLNNVKDIDKGGNDVVTLQRI